MTTTATAPATQVLHRRPGPWDLPEVRWAALALALFLVGLALRLTDAPDVAWWAVFLACYAAGGWEPLVAGLQEARRGRLDVDLLMVLAAIGAAAIGQVLDGALLIVIFSTSGALEAYATRRTEDAVRSLGAAAPQRATLLTADGDRDVDAAHLEPGDVVLVRPGDLVPADGTVREGASSVTEASITGEPLPAEKQPGSTVYAGTTNGDGVLRVHVDVAAADSTLARIAAAVEEAARTKAGRQLFIESVEQRYAVGVVVGTVVLFSVPLLLGQDLDAALLRAMTFMIVASPCALVLATMPPLLAAIATASRHGVLVRSSVALERLAGVDTAVLDKTGTLTRGRPRVTHLLPLDGDGRALLTLAAAVERGSEHPLGRAVVDHARDLGVDVPAATGTRAVHGQGVRATVDGAEVAVLSPAVIEPDARDVGDAVLQVEAGGGTAVVVVRDGVPVGVLGLGDEVRPEAATAVARLNDLTGRDVEVLTGDGEPAARAVAGAVGTGSVSWRLLPEDKAARVRTLQDGGRRVLAVGDGVNDAPALAAAQCGVAMGGGASDLTVGAADVVVVRDDLGAVPAVVDLSRRAQRIVRQNLVIAGSVIVVLVTWDVVGHLPLPLGVAGHEGSTVLVVLNGLRLLRRSAWRG